MLELKCQENARAIAQQIKSSGSGSDVTVTQVVESGTKIATIGVDDVSTDLYAPEVSVTQVLSSGTKIATIAVGDTSTDLYCETVPTPGTPVSVTGDGVKTYTQVCNELFALIDSTKISHTTFLELDSGTNKYYSFICRVGSDYCFEINNPNGRTYFKIASTSEVSSFAYSTATYTDASSSVFPSGQILNLYY